MTQATKQKIGIFGVIAIVAIPVLYLFIKGFLNPGTDVKIANNMYTEYTSSNVLKSSVKVGDYVKFNFNTILVPSEQPDPNSTELFYSSQMFTGDGVKLQVPKDMVLPVITSDMIGNAKQKIVSKAYYTGKVTSVSGGNVVMAVDSIQVP